MKGASRARNTARSAPLPQTKPSPRLNAAVSNVGAGRWPRRAADINARAAFLLVDSFLPSAGTSGDSRPKRSRESDFDSVGHFGAREPKSFHLDPEFFELPAPEGVFAEDEFGELGARAVGRRLASI